MADQITVTSKTGPAIAVTAAVLTNVTDIQFKLDRQVLQITTNGQIKEFDLYLIATVTYTISSHVATVTVSS
jgi:hypothetical protein